MSAYGEEMADRIMFGIQGALTVTKSAAAPAELQMLEAVVRPLCATIGEYHDLVAEHIEGTGEVLRAIAAPTAEQGWMPYQPDQWHTRLMPNLPPRPKNGANSE